MCFRERNRCSRTGQPSKSASMPRCHTPISGQARALLTEVAFPDDVRVDGWIETGIEVTPFYDPMLAKLIVQAARQNRAIAKLKAALSQTSLAGIETNLDYLRRSRLPSFASGKVTTTPFATSFSCRTSWRSCRRRAHDQSQELPGRLGLWHVGVPPGGPMDERSFRHANRLVGNDDSDGCARAYGVRADAALLQGATVALTGAGCR